ncbi:MAG TPA: AtpZ/AtpI family protein [Candidatus Saccharimonadales bacterium]|nr:AtpZ/AtpI family protein [Candidatus Saccharimonadales bacterium]
MVRTVARSKSTAPVVQDELDRSLAVFAARKQFLSAAMNMGWQLAGAVIIPVIIGVKLDDHFRTTPSYTLAALFLAAGGVVMIVRSTINQVRREQANTENSSTSLGVKENKSGK